MKTHLIEFNDMAAPGFVVIFQRDCNALHLAARSPAAKLAQREEEILGCLSEGYSDKDNSDRLGITLPTVRTHLTHIYEKLHVQSRTEAVIKYLQ